MKYFALVVGLAMAFVSSVSNAAQATDKAEIDSQIEMVRSILSTEEKAIVAANLELTNTESEPFWKLYREYKMKKKEVADSYVSLLKDYAAKNATLNDDEAGDMLGRYLDFEKEDLKVTKRYTKKFAKILPSKKVFRFFQIQNKIKAVVDLEMAKGIPLAQ